MRDWVTSRCAGCLHVNGKTCDAIKEPSSGGAAGSQVQGKAQRGRTGGD